MCDECTWHHKTFQVHLYRHLATKLCCTGLGNTVTCIAVYVLVNVTLQITSPFIPERQKGKRGLAKCCVMHHHFLPSLQTLTSQRQSTLCFMCTDDHVLYCVLFYWYLLCSRKANLYVIHRQRFCIAFLIENVGLFQD